MAKDTKKWYGGTTFLIHGEFRIATSSHNRTKYCIVKDEQEVSLFDPEYLDFWKKTIKRIDN